MITAKEISELILIAESCSIDEVKILVKAILSGSIERYKDLSLNDRTKSLIAGFIRGKDIDDIKDAFLSVFMTYEKHCGNVVRPVFTAPKKYQPSQYSTKEEMLKMISSASQSIYIFGFWLTESVKDIISALSYASDRGVKIIIVADSMDNFIRPLRDGWCGKIQPSMYLIKKDATSSADAKMHAKTLVIDERRMMITSANLTYLGLNENLEIGVVIENQMATAKICEFISQVIHDTEFFEKAR